MEFYDLFIAPFQDYIFLRRALVACLALSLSCSPIGVLIILRRMSLMGDALSHSALPGVAIGYIIAGLSLPAMSLGGFIAGLVVALVSGAVSRTTLLKEDASLVGFYLIALASGVIIVSLNGSKIDLLRILLGSVLAVDQASLILVAAISSTTILLLALLYRPFIMEFFDSSFMKSIKGRGSFYHMVFIVLVVANMVAALHALGTLMALGIMMLPAIAARFWARSLLGLFFTASVIAFFSSYVGLILSYHYSWPSGPSIILICGFMYMFSLFLGTQGSLRNRIASV